MTTRTDLNQTFDEDGKLVAEEVVEVDITAETNASAIDQAITDALAELRMMRDYPALPVVPAGTHTTAQLSNYLRTLRDEAQTNRQGIQRVCETLIGTIRLLRGDFDDVG